MQMKNKDSIWIYLEIYLKELIQKLNFYVCAEKKRLINDEFKFKIK